MICFIVECQPLAVDIWRNVIGTLDYNHGCELRDCRLLRPNFSRLLITLFCRHQPLVSLCVRPISDRPCHSECDSQRTSPDCVCSHAISFEMTHKESIGDDHNRMCIIRGGRRMALEQMLACALHLRHVIALYRHYQRSQMPAIIAARFRYDSNFMNGRRKNQQKCSAVRPDATWQELWVIVWGERELFFSFSE